MAAHQERTGRRIAEARARAGLTQEEAAHGAGVTHRAYQRWESGEVTPYPRNLEALAKVFGMEPEALQVDQPQPLEDADLAAQMDRMEGKLDALTEAVREVGRENVTTLAALQDAADALRVEAARQRSPQAKGQSEPPG